MARVNTFVWGGDKIKAVNLSEPSGYEVVVHLENRTDPSSPCILSGFGAFCTQVMPLDGPTFDGAKSVVRFIGISPAHGMVLSKRVKETSEEILAIFKNAGFQTCPSIKPQSRASKVFNKILSTLTGRSAVNALT